jgi:NhaP-type Na+/H+ or K+/H+ antiporter
MDRFTRNLISVVASVLALVGSFLFVIPSGCNDVGGVPSWERCTTPMGTPAYSVEDLGLDATLNVLPPVLIAVFVGLLVWWLLGFSAAGDTRRS